MLTYELANATHVLIQQQIEKLDNWLIRPEVVGGGAVAGSLDQNNRPLYTYPEIAGYYLSYLAYRLQTEPQNGQLLNCAQQIISFQQTLWSHSEWPATRRYSQCSAVMDDWRNQGMFIFDLAMLLRGVADVAVQNKSCLWDSRELVVHIERFFSGAQLEPVRWLKHRPANAPDRWSTRPGAYQLKVLAALQRAAHFYDDQIIITCVKEILAVLVNDFNRGHFDSHNPHSIAYAIEGTLLLGEGYGIDFSIAKDWIARLVSEINSSDIAMVDYRRSDAIAQLLRLSCCEPCFDPAIATRFYDLLISTMQEDGSLQFTLAPCDVTYKNTWPVLFARQALDFYARIMTTGSAIPAREFSCLY